MEDGNIETMCIWLWCHICCISSVRKTYSVDLSWCCCCCCCCRLLLYYWNFYEKSVILFDSCELMSGFISFISPLEIISLQVQCLLKIQWKVKISCFYILPSFLLYSLLFLPIIISFSHLASLSPLFPHPFILSFILLCTSIFFPSSSPCPFPGHFVCPSYCHPSEPSVFISYYYIY